ncbi:MarR family winged helix-turn-helix transcriptional regulator [Gemella morbillorum]|uniref:MarR family winged helix-turn-helix transcriptional regulator n=1 Tax=Gemella morbillorum TaxID=29391 RepID=UPI00248D8D7D|nr:MarR family transcriptional regulator [Gemella morbillorum]
MTSNNQTMSHLEAIDKLDELRILMKKMHKKNNAPYRKVKFHAMMYLCMEEKITMQELGEELGVTKSRVTALVTELLEKGFVIQSVDKKDKRKKYLQLSPKGLEHMDDHKKAYENWFEKIWSKFNSSEKEAFRITLTKVNDVIKEELCEKEEAED